MKYLKYDMIICYTSTAYDIHTHIYMLCYDLVIMIGVQPCIVNKIRMWYLMYIHEMNSVIN